MHSPLKDPGTRYPGQSLSEQIRDISEDQSSELVVPFMLMPVVAFAWTQQFWPNLIKPWMITLIAVVASAWSIRRNLAKGLLASRHSASSWIAVDAAQISGHSRPGL